MDAKVMLTPNISNQRTSTISICNTTILPSFTSKGWKIRMLQVIPHTWPAGVHVTTMLPDLNNLIPEHLQNIACLG